MNPLFSISRRLLAALALVVTTGLIGCAHDPRPAQDTHAIHHLLMSTFDKPEARLQVEPIVVVGSHAIAGWAQGERGGRALLARDGHGWQITLCAGDGLHDEQLLRDAGLSAADSQALVSALAAAEAALSPALLAKFATFDGVVRMDAHGQHPPAGAHH